MVCDGETQGRRGGEDGAAMKEEDDGEKDKKPEAEVVSGERMVVLVWTLVGGLGGRGRGVGVGGMEGGGAGVLSGAVAGGGEGSDSLATGHGGWKGRGGK